MDVNEVNELREALRRADFALAGLRNALIVERELQARCAELERERDAARAEVASLEAQAEQDERYASGLEGRLFELKHSNDMRALALRDQHAQIAALTAERDAARADLARYTAVYGDPDAPVDVASFAVGKPDCAPLFPELAAMADRILAGEVPDGVCVGKEIHDGTPLGAAIMQRMWDLPAMNFRQIKVGDHVRCESLGNLTGIVETVNPSDKPGWDQCLVRDDREGHVWGAAAFVLEVIR